MYVLRPPAAVETSAEILFMTAHMSNEPLVVFKDLDPLFSGRYTLAACPRPRTNTMGPRPIPSH